MFPYADMYVGFIMLYHTPNYFELNGEKVSGLPTHKFLGGNVEPQLVYSYNGVHFNRFCVSRSSVGADLKTVVCILPVWLQTKRTTTL